MSESHEVQTEDGYLLTLHRIGRPGDEREKPVVFLMHCIIASSSIWVLYGRESSLAYKLVDAGYDVWMGNARGNSYSKAHRTLDTDGAQYWNFSWHEIGVYDLPASIDYVLDRMGREQLQYIGYSMVSGRKGARRAILDCWVSFQGTTVFYVMLAERPEYNDKVSAMQGWGPVAYLSHIDAPNLSQFLDYIDQIEVCLHFLNVLIFEVIEHNHLKEALGRRSFWTIAQSVQ
jgi:lysosomal acid lipase/cholesteryl ester hydrolase